MRATTRLDSSFLCSVEASLQLILAATVRNERSYMPTSTSGVTEQGGEYKVDGNGMYFILSFFFGSRRVSRLPRWLGAFGRVWHELCCGAWRVLRVLAAGVVSLRDG